jgi:hypothetical protein
MKTRTRTSLNTGLPDKRQYKALPLLIMMYLTIMLTSVVLVYKIVDFHGVVIAASTLVIPLWYFLGDVIAEVYGYKLSKKIIWSSLICEGFFIFICAIFIHFPSPNFWHNQEAYEQVLGRLPRIFLGSILGIMSSSFINAYLVVKWKILLHGKFFWIRSVCSSAIGEIIFTMITIAIDLLGVIPLGDLIKLIFISYGIKLLVDAFAIVPAAMLANFLKKLEGVDVYEYNVKFNPFKESLM